MTTRVRRSLGDPATEAAMALWCRLGRPLTLPPAGGLMAPRPSHDELLAALRASPTAWMYLDEEDFQNKEIALAAVLALVERFDTELISKISAKSSNFRRLVLSCINADFCVQILILQRFSKPTRLSHLCTDRNSKSS